MTTGEARIVDSLKDAIAFTLIARVCHEVNRAACAAWGDHSQLPWADAPAWQQQSAIRGVKYALAHPDATPEDMHSAWLRDKEADGWTYGPVKNVEKKQHPCFVTYPELPVEQRLKDYLFQAVVHSLASFSS